MKKLWITLACLVVIIIGLDRVGVVVTNLALEGALRDKLLLQSKPKVRVHGIPFLTQVLGGKYNDIEVDASGLQAQKMHNLSVKVKLRGVHVSITDLGKWDFSTIPIDHTTAEITVPYNSLEAASGIDGITLKADGNQLDFTAPLSAAGTTIDVTGKAHPSISHGALLLNPSDVTAAGTQIPAEEVAAFNAPISIADLPFGLKLTGVHVTSDGLLGDANVDDVVIRDGKLVSR